mgnify:CR=1 FL=1
MPKKFELDHMLKAQQWERAKGELRAFAAMCGSYDASEGMGERWDEIVADITIPYDNPLLADVPEYRQTKENSQ